MEVKELSSEQLQQAAEIKGQIEQLTSELESVLGGAEESQRPAPAPSSTARRPISNETKQKIAAAQKARWAKLKRQ